MDSNRFDAFTRGISANDTRRGVLKTLAAVGAGLGLTQIGQLLEVEAGKKRRKRRNRKRKKKLNKRCKKNKQCKGKLACKKSDPENSCFGKTKKRCCIREGKPCDDSCDCCGINVICNGGYCQNV